MQHTTLIITKAGWKMSQEGCFRTNDSHFATKAAHSGQEPEQWNSMAVVPPISLSTTFKQDGPHDFRM